MQTNKPRIALFVDAEGIGQDRICDIVQRLSMRGTIVAKRAFGNWSVNELSSWESTSRTLGMHLIHQPGCTQFNHEVEVLIAIHAIELLHRGDVDTFVIVSERCNFVSLAIHLREAGARTVLYSINEPVQSLVSAFDECHTHSQKEVVNVPSCSFTHNDIHTLALLINQTEHADDKFTDISLLGQYIKTKHPKFRFSQLDIKGLRDFLCMFPQYYVIETKKSAYRYRCTPCLKKMLSETHNEATSIRAPVQDKTTLTDSDNSAAGSKTTASTESEEIVITNVRKKGKPETSVCISCGGLMPYIIKEYAKTMSVNDISFSYIEHAAVCATCGTEMYVPAVSDRNVRARLEAFRKASEEIPDTTAAAAKSCNDIEPKLTPQQKRVVEYLKEHPLSAPSSVAEVLSVKPERARRILGELVAKGFAVVEKKRKQSVYSAAHNQ